MEAKTIAMEFNNSAVDIALRSGIPRARKIGIKINAAPTPAMVKTVVKINVTADAIRYVVSILNFPNIFYNTNSTTHLFKKLVFFLFKFQDH